MFSTNKPTEKNDIKRVKHKTSGLSIIENDASTQQKIFNFKPTDRHHNVESNTFIEVGNEKHKKERNKVPKDFKKDTIGSLLLNNSQTKFLNHKRNILHTGKLKESKIGGKKYKHKTFEISNDLLSRLKNRIEMKKVLRKTTKEQANIFQTKFPGNEYDCKDESMTNETILHERKSCNYKNLERKKSINIETCMEIDLLTKSMSQKNIDVSKTFSNQSLHDRKNIVQKLNKKIHRYAMYDCKEEYEKNKKLYMFPNNKNNNWIIYDEYGNPWWTKFKIGPLSKLLVLQKNDEDTTDDGLAINTQALLQVKEKRFVYSEPQEEDGFNDVFGPLKDLALCNDTQYGKTRIWWISLRNVIQMSLTVSKTKKNLLKDDHPKVEEMERFNEKDPITFVKYIKGLPKKQKITQQIIQQIPVRAKPNEN